MNVKKYEIIISILTILTVLATAVGVSVAYFTSSMTGTPADINTTTANIGGAVFDGGNDFTTASEIEPGWEESKTFTITVPPSDFEQTVYVKMTYTNGMPDLTCTVQAIANGAKGNIPLNSSSTETTVTLVEKTFAPSTESQSLTYDFTMALPETGVNQNASQGKIFNGTLFAELGSKDLYYNAANPNGTTEKPTGN